MNNKKSSLNKRNNHKKDVRWRFFRPDLMALIMMFIYGYAIALIGTGYEGKIFFVGMAAIIILFIVLLMDLIANLVDKKKKNEPENETTLVEYEDPVDVFDKEELKDSEIDYYIDKEEDPDNAYKKMKERKYENGQL